MPVTPDVILLHGALGASSQLDALADELRPPFRIHQIDFEGHANAPSAGRPFRIEHFAENVIARMDTERISSARFFGYSMGGYVALYLALHRPDLVECVATLGTRFRWDRETAEREAARLDPGAIRAKVPRFADALAARHERAGGWEGVLAQTADLLRHLGQAPLLTDATLARIRQPVRIIVGDRDNTVSVDESTSVARALSNGSVTVLPDTPHPIEQVEVLALTFVLRDFLALQVGQGVFTRRPR
ncbi:MAG TPA: alpha/beta hydrolase [Gemmatimonadaceae bacterium]|nr:alpha/beta hydrolase [Gemmatimonadaceae bacterium]